MPRKQSFIMTNRGFNLDNLDVTTVEEWEGWRQSERENRGYPLPTYEIFGEYRPDVVKRWFRQIHHMNDPEGGSWHSGGLAYLHYYAIVAFEAGIGYEINNMEAAGYSRDTVVDVLALAFLHSVSSGMHSASDFIRERLRAYREPEKPYEWPDGWQVDPDFWKSGIDFSVPQMQPGELELIEGWWRERVGEPPLYVEMLGKLRPNMLKMWWNRFENVFRATPPQVMPYCQLHFETIRGHEQGIREAVQMAKGFGLTQAQTVDAAIWATLYSAPDGLSNVWRAAGDLLESW